MKTPSSLLAAALVCVFAAGVSGTAEGRSHHSKKASSREKAASRPKAHGRSHSKAKAGTGVSRSRSRSAGVRASGGSKARAGHGRARRVIHQNDRGEVVLDRLETAGAVLGPVSPRELFNYPPSPYCVPVDVVIEAHVHEVAADAPEGDAPDGQAPLALAQAEEGSRQTRAQAEADAEPSATVAGAAASLSRIAHSVGSKVGSFFRPKSSATEVKPQDVDLTELVSNRFMIPVEGVDAERLRDSFLSSRGRHAKHLAIDIGAPKGTPVLATTDGEITKISRERRGGKAIYQKDATGQYLLFYCHLSQYAEDLSVGRRVKRGDVIGYVGSTGHVIGGSHLHFSITRVPGDGESFKKGLAINPYLLFLAGVP